MVFSLQYERTGLEYHATSLNTLFAQRRNLLRPSIMRMLADILRFNQRSRELLQREDDSLTLGDYLKEGHYSRAFIDHYILPMGRAIWSAEADRMLEFPARFFVEFFDRHGFLNINDRPQWQAIRGGSREYVRKLLAATRARLWLSTPIGGVRRYPDHVIVRTARGDSEHFDAVFVACHSDQA